MAGRFVNFIRRNNPVIDSILGNINDITVKSNLKDALDELKGFKKQRDDYNKFATYQSALNNVNLQYEEYFKPTEDFKFNVGEDMLSGTETYKALVDTMKAKQPADNTTGGEQQPMKISEEEFKQFIKNNPDYYKELFDKKYISTVYEPITREEADKKRYEKAGLTDPNEIAWFNEYAKKRFNPNDYNEKLTQFVYGKQPGLTSRGRLGDSQYQMLANYAGMLGITPRESEDPMSKIDPGKWQVGDFNGSKYYYANVYNQGTGQWEKRFIRELNADELQQQTGKKGNKLSDLTPAELSNLTYDELLTKYSASDISNNFDKLPKEFQDKFYERFPDWKPEEDTGKTGSRSRTGGRRRSYGGKLSGNREKLPYDNDLKAMSDLGMKYKDKKWEDWSLTDQEKYNEHMQKIQNITGKTKEEIWNEVGVYEQDKYYKKDKTEKQTGKVKSPYGNEIDENERFTINEVYYRYNPKLVNNFGGKKQSLHQWVNTLHSAPNRETFYKWADEVRQGTAAYLDDLTGLGLTSAMAREIEMDVENVIQSIKNKHQGW